MTVARSAQTRVLLFEWNLDERMRIAHLVVPAVLLLLIAAVVFAAHGVLKRVLLPLRWLGDGVTALSEGYLDVVVPKRSGDEFGALTDAFNRMVGRIKDMIRARDQLLLDVSHELGSPVTRLKSRPRAPGRSEHEGAYVGGCHRNGDHDWRAA